MPVLDPEISALIGTLQSLDDAIAFGLGRLGRPCLDCAAERRCTVHSYDERLVERYQARYAAAFSGALVRLDPDAIVPVIRPGGVRPATALHCTAILTRLQETVADRPAVTEREGQPAVTEPDRQAARRTIHAAYRRCSRLARIRLRHPGTRRPLLSDPITVLFPALRTPTQPARYTPELAMELLNGTSELPAGKRALHLILAEHRRALHDLAAR
jgi:hypothetical protein